MRHLARGADYYIIALDIGLGKTLVALSIADVLRRSQDRYCTLTIHFGPLEIEPAKAAALVKHNYIDKMFLLAPGEQPGRMDLARLAGRTPTLRQGMTLIVCPVNLIA